MEDEYIKNLPTNVKVEIAKQKMSQQARENQIDDILKRKDNKDKKDRKRIIKNIIIIFIISFVLYTLFGILYFKEIESASYEAGYTVGYTTCFFEKVPVLPRNFSVEDFCMEYVCEK